MSNLIQEEMAAPLGEPVGHQGAGIDIAEKRCPHLSGGIALIGLLAVLVCLGLLIVTENAAGSFLLIVVLVMMVTSIRIIPPGKTYVCQFLGRYIGTVRSTGLVLVPPLVTGKKLSIKVRNFETNIIKVNDLNGNPINIAAIVVWQVSETAQALFAVESYDDFVATQSEAALRHVATSHPYDSADGYISLLGSTDEVSNELAHEVAERVALAGVKVIEVRISALSYAPEIAQAMLQRQQAAAVISAREQIVEGAVTMVNSAIERLEKESVVELDEERKAHMVSNLLVVLCSESRTTPVLNAGSLYS